MIMSTTRQLLILLMTLAFVLVTACSSGSKKPEYYGEVETPALEIPAGLSKPDSSSALVIQTPYRPPPALVMADKPPRISSTTSGIKANSRLNWSAQGLYLLGAYLFLALPFFFSGLIISIGYTTLPERSGLVYFATMAGSALGAVVPLILLPFLGEEKLIVLTAAVPVIAALLPALNPLNRKREKIAQQPFFRIVRLTASTAILALVFFSLTPAGAPLIHVAPSPYKALGQILQFPATSIVVTRTGVRGRIDRERPAIAGDVPIQFIVLLEEAK